MKSAGHDILAVDNPKGALPAPPRSLAPEVSEPRARASARRLAVMLMAASGLTMLAILGGIWFLLWRYL